MLLTGHLITLRCQGLLKQDNGVIGKVNHVDIIEVSDNFKKSIDNHITEILIEHEIKEVEQFVKVSSDFNTSSN